MFVKDPQDDIDRILALSHRRADREARLAAPISLLDLLKRGPHETTPCEELIKQEEHDTAILNGHLKEDPKDLIAKAIFAARSGNVSELEAAIDTFGVPLDARDENGNTLLILAAQQNDKRLVKLLLRRGADPNLLNHSGNSALHFCFGYSYTDLGEYLVQKGAKDDVTNKDGLTCYEFNVIDNV